MTEDQAKTRWSIATLITAAMLIGWIIAVVVGNGLLVDLFQALMLPPLFVQLYLWGWAKGNAATGKRFREEAYAKGWRDACIAQDEEWSAGGYHIG